MRVIKPITITDAKFTSSTIAEPDVSKGEVAHTAGTYVTGTRRIKTSTHRVYEVTADPSTTDDPEVGVLKNPQTWVDVASTNKWAMFDTVNSSKSIQSTQLIVEITNGQTVNSLSGFAIEQANAINITVTDPAEGIVYNTDVDMVDNSEVTDWYFYYFAPIVQVTEFVLFDLPAYPLATIKITTDGNEIKIGSFVLGNQISLGVANYGTSVQLLDFSKKETDSFGNVVVKKGRTSKLVDFDVTIRKEKVNYVFNILSSLTTIPSVWVGDDGSNDPTLVFGYYKDYQNNISSPTITDATIQIEGLV